MTTRRSLFALLATCAVAVSLVASRPEPGPSGEHPSREVQRTVAAAAEPHVAAADRRVAAEGGSRGLRSSHVADAADDAHTGRRAANPHAATISFAEPTEFATGATPSAVAFNRAEGDQLAFQISRAYLADSVAAGDFDEDPSGHVDVVQTNVLAGTISVFRGNGRGGFSSPRLIPVGTCNLTVATQLTLLANRTQIR